MGPGSNSTFHEVQFRPIWKARHIADLSNARPLASWHVDIIQIEWAFRKVPPYTSEVAWRNDSWANIANEWSIPPSDLLGVVAANRCTVRAIGCRMLVL